MLEIVKKILVDVLTAFYQPFWFSVLLAVFLMFFLMYAKEQKSENLENAIKKLLKKWVWNVRNSSDFRRTFALLLCASLIAFKTLLNRNMWANPLSDVWGTWGLWTWDKNEEAYVITTEVPENLFLFFPFILLFLWRFQEWFSCRKLRDFLWISAKYTFLFSISIEMLQLFLRLGTWQVSDLFFNTLGGTIGGLVYWAGYKIKEKRSAQENLKYADQNL